MKKDQYGYSEPNCYTFDKVSDFLMFVEERYHEVIDYKKIKFEHLPEKISIVIADNEPKDIFSYYRKDESLEKEHINLRNGLKKK
jgi:hypothetical protein